MVEDSESDGGFPNPPWTNESDWGEVVSETDNLLDQFVTPKTAPCWWGRELTGCAICIYEVLGASVVEVTGLVRAWVMMLETATCMLIANST